MGGRLLHLTHGGQKALVSVLPDCCLLGTQARLTSPSFQDCDSGDRSQEKQAVCEISSGSGNVQYHAARAAGSAMAPSPQGIASVQHQHAPCGLVSSVGLATQPLLVPPVFSP